MKNDLFDVTQSEILKEFGVAAEEDDNALGCVEKRSQNFIKENPLKSTLSLIILLCQCFWSLIWT